MLNEYLAKVNAMKADLDKIAEFENVTTIYSFSVSFACP